MTDLDRFIDETARAGDRPADLTDLERLARAVRLTIEAIPRDLARQASVAPSVLRSMRARTPMTDHDERTTP